MKLLYKHNDGWYQNNDWDLWGTMEIEGKQSIPQMFKEAFVEMEKVTDDGGLKYGYSSWLDPNNHSLEHKANYASISRHFAESYCKVKKDHSSGIDPRLHAVVRILMDYTRDIRGIVPTSLDTVPVTSSLSVSKDEEVPGYEGLNYEDYKPGGAC